MTDKRAVKMQNFQQPLMEENFITDLAKLRLSLCSRGIKECHCIYYLTNQPGPGAAREKFDELTLLMWTFFVKQSFFSSDLVRFWRGHTCVKNPP